MLTGENWCEVDEDGRMHMRSSVDGHSREDAVLKRLILLEAVAESAREVDDWVSPEFISNRRLLAACEKLHGALDALDGKEKDATI